jgi:F-type H+-transporting ATPase subunit delta
MEELIAKKYIKAMINGADVATLKNLSLVFSTLANSFEDSNFSKIFENPYVDIKDKEAILLEAVKGVKSKEINNFIKLLVEKNRINLIPEIAEEMRKKLADITKTYQGVIYSDTNIDKKTIDKLSNSLSKKFDSKIKLVFEKNDFDGIKVDVDDLGIELNFSKTRISSQMIEHIIKAI